MTESQRAQLHEILEDAMQKKDRYITIFFTNEATSVNIYPISNDKTWIVKVDDDGEPDYICPECYGHSKFGSFFCPWCGEKLLNSGECDIQ